MAKPISTRTFFKKAKSAPVTTHSSSICRQIATATSISPGLDESRRMKALSSACRPMGKPSDIVCRDFRHPNGMGAGGPHDWITVTDNPHGRAVYNGVAIVRDGEKYGYDGARTTPMLAVLPPSVDSSSGGQCWSDPNRWGPLSDQMIHTSYSRCAMFYVLTQNATPHPNGFAIRMPFNFRSGAMRARANPADGQIYVVGQKGWDTIARFDGCLYRIRYTGEPSRVIVNAVASRRGISLSFTCDLDPESIDKRNIAVIREAEKGTSPVKMSGVQLVANRTIEIELPEIVDEVVERRTNVDKKTGHKTVDVRWPIRIDVDVSAKDGTPISQTVYATINSLPDE